MLAGFGASATISNVSASSSKNDKQRYNGQLYQDASFLVSRCVFDSFGSSALAIKNGNADMAITETTFINCACWWDKDNPKPFGDNGGSHIGDIYFFQAGGGLCAYVNNSEVRRVCGYQCEAEFGLVLFVVAKGENVATDVASRDCHGQSEHWGQDTFRFMYGKQIMEGFNSSTNSVGDDGAAFESAWSTALKMLHCSFLNNRGKGTISLFVADKDTGNHDNNWYVNVFNNTGQSPKGVVTFVGKITLRSWIFTQNKAICWKEDNNPWLVCSASEPPLFGRDEGLAGANKIGGTANITAVGCIFDTTNYGVGVDETECGHVDQAVTHIIAHWQTTLCPADFSFTFTPFAEPERGEQIERIWRFGAFAALTTV